MGYDPEVMERVKNLNVIDDTLFQKMAEDIGFQQEMISTILEQQVTVVQTIPQNSVKNLQGRSVVFDAFCTLEDSTACNVEVQKKNDDDYQRRMRYNGSCFTANITEPGDKFEKVPNMCSIFISRFDIFKEKKTVYHVDRIVRETGKEVYNGLREISQLF